MGATSPNRLWPLAALLALAPIVALSGGCGGGSGGGLFGGATPTPRPIATATPTATPANSPVITNALITLGNGQAGTLNVSRVGNALSGTLLVVARQASPQLPQDRTAKSFNFSTPAGTYTVSGTFTPPRGFTLSGDFPAPLGNFSLVGQIPTTASAGSYTISAAGQTQSGAIPVISNPTPTTQPTTGPTSSPTTTPTTITGGGSLPASSGGTDTLTLAGSGSGVGANFSEAGYFAIAPFNGVTQLRLEGTTPRNDTTPYRDIIVSAFKTGTLKVGDSFTISPATTGQRASVLISYAPAGSSTGTVYYGVSGTVTITGATATGFSVALSNVKINGIGSATGGKDDFHIFPTGSATGTYTN